jgi:hypothetical protein
MKKKIALTKSVNKINHFMITLSNKIIIIDISQFQDKTYKIY